MGAVGHTGQGRSMNGRLGMIASAVMLSLLVVALVVPAAASAAESPRRPRLVVQTLVAELVPGKSLDAFLTYTTDEPATIEAVLTFLGDSAGAGDRAVSDSHSRSNDLARRQKSAERNLSARSADTRHLRTRTPSPAGPTIVLSASDGSIFWDGSQPCGNCAPAGTYLLRLIATDADGHSSRPQTFLVTVVAAE